MTDAAPPTRRLLRIATRAMPLELLFDLVFLFTVTQVTHVVLEHPDALGIGRALVLLTVVYVMYDGYIWLLNQIAGDVGRVSVRVFVFAAMAAFLVLAAAIPHAFDSARLAFGVAFLIAVVIHSLLFFALGSRGNLRAMLRAAPANLVAGGVLIVAAFADEGVAAWLPLVALAVMAAGIPFRTRASFDLGVSHLVERHGLLMIIVFGESIVGVGLGLTERGLDLATVLAAVLAVGVVGGMWWTYFSVGPDGEAEERVSTREPDERSSLAIRAYFVDHLAMMFGLVLFAAGIRLAFESVLGSAAPTTAFLMSAGLGVYLAAQAVYRWDLGAGAVLPRLIGAVLATAVGIIGIYASSLLELAALLVVVIAVSAARRRAHTSGNPGIG